LALGLCIEKAKANCHQTVILAARDARDADRLEQSDLCASSKERKTLRIMVRMHLVTWSSQHRVYTLRVTSLKPL
jgi:hypothetical protein